MPNDILETLSPAEKLYLDVTKQNANEVTFMPQNLDQLWDIIFKTVYISEDAQEILRKHYWGQKSYSEIAKAQCKSTQAIVTKARRAIRKLRTEASMNILLYGVEYLDKIQEIKAQWYENAKRFAEERYQNLKEQAKYAMSTRDVIKLEALDNEIQKELKRIRLTNSEKIENMPGLSQELIHGLESLDIRFIGELAYKVGLVETNLPTELRQEMREYIARHDISVIKNDIDMNDITMTSLNFSPRTYLALHRADITTLSRLQNMTISELENLRGIGEHAVKEITDTLGLLGIALDEN